MSKLKFSSVQNIHEFFSTYVDRYVTIYDKDEDDEEVYCGKLVEFAAKRYEDTFSIILYFLNEEFEYDLDVNEESSFDFISDNQSIPE